MKKNNRFLRIPKVLPLRTKGLYHEVPDHDLSATGTPFSDASPYGSPLLTPTSRRGLKPRWRKGFRQISIKRAAALCAAIALVIFLVVGGYKRQQHRIEEEEARAREENRPKYHWEHFPR